VHVTRDTVALIIAVAIGTAMNCFTFAVLYDAITSQGPGLSANAAQVLTGWGGGMIGLLGAYIGFKAGSAPDTTTSAPPEVDREEPTP
jgi:hypothetical protein